MSKIRFTTIEGRSPGFYALLAGLGVLLAAAAFAWHTMEVEGHWVTGMSNQVIWGTPHIFAVFLIVAASGALNTASISSVFQRAEYKPMARLSALLAVALLVGGLAILVLDLGRPDRLIVAMTYYNFKSIFAWNIFLYTGFIAIVAVYLWMMMDRNMTAFARPAGIAAFTWRIILTTGTGSIFGFLIARDALGTALLAPMFVILSFSYGTAIFLLVLVATYRWTKRPLSDAVVLRVKNLLSVFVISVFYFVVVYHITNLYFTAKHDVEAFLLLDGGPVTQAFWWVQIGLGTVVPLALFWSPWTRDSIAAAIAGSILVILGGFGQMYVTIIGSQLYPLELFPGKEISSDFYDGVVGQYAPSSYEVMLGLGGVALALLIVVLALKVLPFIPERLGEAKEEGAS
jgi:molybdopterin-containing oxidoreductase family membrane subunit